MKYKIAVVGGGPGGYVAAIRASQMGAKVALVEQAALGGTCLHHGCIPTKNMLSTSSLIREMKGATSYGINIRDFSFDYETFVDLKDKLISKMNQSINLLLQKNKVDLFMGKGCIVGFKRISICDRGKEVVEIEADNIIIATGSFPQTLPGLDNISNAVTSSAALTWRSLPKSILIIGGGAIGCELAVLFNNLGVEVTLLEIQPTILSGVDRELAAYLLELLSKRGIKVVVDTGIVSMDESGGIINTTLSKGETLAVEKAIVSIGRSFNTGELGLDKLGVALGSKGEIIVNEYLQTSVEGIYAVGDVTNKTLLAHVASAQGIAAVQNIVGQSAKINYDAVPHCIYTMPEIASVGITEDDALNRGLHIKIGKFPFLYNGRALADSKTEGMVKIIADARSDQILGVHIIGCHATELIAEGALAISHGVKGKELAACIHAHPTLSECMGEATNALYGMSIHS